MEFYETLLKFVLFKLYQSDLGLNYPPGMDDKLEEYGVYMAAVRGTPVGQEGIDNKNPQLVGAESTVQVTLLTCSC